MRRSWLAWATSIVAFFLTAVLAITLGSAKAPNVERVSQLSDTRLSDTRLSDTQLSTIPGSPNFSAAKTSAYPPSNFYPANSPATIPGTSVSAASKAAPSYQPAEVVYLADPSNYGQRFTVDASGNPVTNDYLVVLHETVGSASSAINLFQTHHPRDEDQVSYHTLITLDGTVVYVVPPEQRAFGAGNSSFPTSAGEESVFTNPDFPSSVNNFAYHISLETPGDGQNNNARNHSGYTAKQYQSLAWLLSRTTVPEERITTHKHVDRSGTRTDPRSFDPEYLFSLLRQYPSRAGL